MYNDVQSYNILLTSANCKNLNFFLESQNCKVCLNDDLVVVSVSYPDDVYVQADYLIFTALARNASIASAVLATAIPSVRLSVCPSVRLSVRHTLVLCQNDGT